jgi:hypothetical protein
VVRQKRQPVAAPVISAAMMMAAVVLSDGWRIQSAQRGPAASMADAGIGLVLGRPTDRAIAASVLAPTAIEAFIEYGTAPGQYSQKTPVEPGTGGMPFEIGLARLRPNTRYYYRLQLRTRGSTSFGAAPPQTFVTARARGAAFAFGVQGDSHPERAGKMYDASLYRQTMDLVAAEQPDLYVMLGDDFSIEQLIGQKTISRATVNQVYANQRPFVSRMAGSTALFLVNGNQEEAARVLMNGSPDSPAVFAVRADRLLPCWRPACSTPATRYRSPTSGCCATTTPGRGTLLRSSIRIGTLPCR